MIRWKKQVLLQTLEILLWMSGGRRGQLWENPIGLSIKQIVGRPVFLWVPEPCDDLVGASGPNVCDPRNEDADVMSYAFAEVRE